jgi:hypothetical protein
MHGSDKRSLFPALQLTDACNKNCVACLRSPDATMHHLHYTDFQKYLDDLRRLSQDFTIGYQFVTGGEPTLWKHAGKDIIDVLAELRALGFIGIVTMPSNGKLFEDLPAARAWLSRLSERLDGPIVLGLSVSTFQENLTGGRCQALDNKEEPRARRRVLDSSLPPSGLRHISHRTAMPLGPLRGRFHSELWD